MTESTNESSSKLLRLEILFFLHTEEEMEEEEDVTPIEELPKWTVREIKNGFEIEEGIEVVKDALGRRFNDPWKSYVREEIAVDLTTMPAEPFDGVFEG